MTSFFPTDAIRSRLEWNATLNPAAAPQTTEETRYHRKVSTLRIPKQKNQVHLLLRRLLLRPSVSLGEHIPDSAAQWHPYRSEGEQCGEASSAM
jgi:hypothetical protein